MLSLSINRYKNWWDYLFSCIEVSKCYVSSLFHCLCRFGKN